MMKMHVIMGYFFLLGSFLLTSCGEGQGDKGVEVLDIFQEITCESPDDLERLRENIVPLSSQFGLSMSESQVSRGGDGAVFSLTGDDMRIDIIAMDDKIHIVGSSANMNNSSDDINMIVSTLELKDCKLTSYFS